MKNYFVKSEEKNCIDICFHEIFQNDELKFINTFHMNRKKLYVNIVDDIIETNNIIFTMDEENGLIIDYLAMKYKIDRGDYETPKDFVKDLHDTFATPYMKDIIIRHVDANYQLDLDGLHRENMENPKKKPIPANLQFTDYHTKLLMRISTFMRFLIPLITEYLYMNRHINVRSFLMLALSPVFPYLSENINIRGKLHESIYARIITTKHSDKAMWNYMEFFGLSMDSVIDDLTHKLCCDIIPKYSFDQNPVNLNHVIIETNRDYAFRVDYGMSYNPIIVNENSSNQMRQQMDDISSVTSKLNESKYILSKHKITTDIQRILTQYDLKPEELEGLPSPSAMNPIQKQLVFLFFGKYLKDPNVIYLSNFEEYSILVGIMSHLLNKKGMVKLADVVMGSPEKPDIRRVISKTRIIKAVESNAYYPKYLEKYEGYIENVDENGPLFSLLYSIASHQFSMVDDSVLEIDLVQISDELLRFVLEVI